MQLTDRELFKPVATLAGSPLLEDVINDRFFDSLADEAARALCHGRVVLPLQLLAKLRDLLA